MVTSTFALPRRRPKNQFPFTRPILSGGRASGGYTPNYMNALTGDPLYQQQLANVSAAGIQSAAERKASVGQALTQFGEVPDFAGMGLDSNSPLYKSLLGDVTPDVTRSASGLTDAGLSTVAGLSRGHTKAIGDLIASLAGRGALQSGATGVGLQQEDQNYAGQQFKARNDLLSYLTGVQHAYAQSEGDRQNTLATAAQDAATRQIGLNPAVPGTAAPKAVGAATAVPHVSRLLTSANLMPTRQATAYTLPGNHGGSQ